MRHRRVSTGPVFNQVTYASPVRAAGMVCAYRTVHLPASQRNTVAHLLWLAQPLRCWTEFIGALTPTTGRHLAHARSHDGEHHPRLHVLYSESTTGRCLSSPCSGSTFNNYINVSARNRWTPMYPSPTRARYDPATIVNRESTVESGAAQSRESRQWRADT